MGCGGGDGGCGAAPCGGDLTGSWTISRTCVDNGPRFFSGCSEARVDGSGIGEAGTVVFNADLTYTSSLAGSATFSNASCRSASGGCVCTPQLIPRTLSTSGTYATSGTTLNDPCQCAGSVNCDTGALADYVPSLSLPSGGSLEYCADRSSLSLSSSRVTVTSTTMDRVTLTKQQYEESLAQRSRAGTRSIFVDRQLDDRARRGRGRGTWILIQHHAA